MKKLFFLIIGLTSYITTFAEKKIPPISCDGIPGCDGGKNSSSLFVFLGKFVSELIKYVAVAAVIALIFAGIMYITSGGEDEKLKKSKKWIIYSLIAVFISISGYFIINLVNETQINI